MIRWTVDAPRSEEARPVPRTLLIWLVICGVAGPLIFDVVYVVEGATRPGYDAWQQSISSLSLGPGGWVQQADFIFVGVVTLGVAVIWRSILYGGICATWYPITRVIEGVGLIMIAIFSTDPTAGYPPGAVPPPPFSTLHGVLHFVFLFFIIGAMMCGLFVMARRFAGDQAWRGWIAYSVISALMVNFLIALFGVSNGHDFEYSGVIERLATNVETLWTILIAGRLWVGTPFFRRPWSA